MHQIDRAVPGIVQRPHTHVLYFFLVLIVSSDVAPRCWNKYVPVARIRHDKAALAAPATNQVLRRDYTLLAPACDAYIRVVLLRTINVIGVSIVSRDVIKLCRRLVILRRPGFPAIHRDTGAAIVGVADPIRIFRINPEPVMITMTRRQKIEGLSAVHRFECAGIEHINGID